MAAFTFEWDRGKAEIQPLAGMLGPIEFRMDDGHAVQPMAVAPWYDDDGADFDSLPGILKQLRGEWPCVPFGAPSPPAGLSDDWQAVNVAGAGADLHGYSSHNNWSLSSTFEGGVELSIDYPADHVIRRLARRIRGVTGKTRVDINLTVEARADVTLPIALHPVFRLPAQTGALIVDPGPFACGRIFPLPVEPGVSRLSQGATFSALDRVPAGSETIRISALPLEFDTEELVQLCGVEGTVTLENHAERYRAKLAYDPAVFPSLVLWISNRGRRNYPWNGRHLALGVEPTCGAFDLGPQVGCNPNNPIAADGFPTAVQFRAGQAFTTTYTIAVECL